MIPALERSTGALAMTKGVAKAAAVAAKTPPFDNGFDRRRRVDARAPQRRDRGGRDR